MSGDQNGGRGTPNPDPKHVQATPAEPSQDAPLGPPAAFTSTVACPTPEKDISRAEVDQTTAPALDSRLPPAIGAAYPPIVPADTYQIVGEFARGGLGRILKAYDRRLARAVAIKELLHSTSESARRFLREALITAHLQHPGIVPVYEAGYWNDSAPFYAMKMVSGRSFHEVIEQARSLEERLALLPNMIAVAEAVAYAHSEGIIHRDLKPSNVLVGSFGETVVIDWGLAKSVAENEDADRAEGESPRIPSQELTVVGSVIGTPVYMAPEQAKGLPADKRGDVYALGAMLYQLLSGAAPYSGQSAAEILQKVAAGAQPVSLEERQPRAPPDLSAIVRKAMAPKPEDRYPTAQEFAADLRRFQTGQLVSAHAYSIWSLVLRWVSRHRTGVAMAAIFLVVLAAVAALSVRRIVQEKDRAEQERNRAEARSHDLTLIQARSSLEHDPTATIAWLKTLPTQIEGWGAVRTIAADAEDRGIAERVLRGHGASVNSVAFLPDGRRVASSGYDKTIRIWDLGANSARVFSGHSDIVSHLAVSADGRTLASASDDKRVGVWDLETGNHRFLSGHEKTVWYVAFSPDSKSIASASDDTTVRIWDVATGGSRVLTGHSNGVMFAVFSPDGKQLASGGLDKTLRLWDLKIGSSRILSQHEAVVNGAVFSPDGHKLLSYSDDHTMQLWDLISDKSVLLRGHTGWVNEARFSPNGEILASASEDKTIRLWDSAGQLIQILRGHEGAVRYITFSPDGRWLASGGRDNSVRLWNMKTGESRVFQGHTAQARMVQFSPSGEFLVSGSWDDTLRLWKVSEGAAVLQSPKPMRHAAFSSDSRLVAAGGDDRTVRLWNVSTGQIDRLEGHRDRINYLTFSPDGKTFASASKDGTVRIWDIAGAPIRVLEGHRADVTTLLFTPDGSTLFSGSADHAIRIWNIVSGKSDELKGHDNTIEHLALSPDRKLLASASTDKTVRLWDLSTHQAKVLGPFATPVHRVAFSKDGHWLASASDFVRLWDLQTQHLTVLQGNTQSTVDVLFAAEERVVSGGMDKRVLVWSLPSGKSTILRGHDTRINAMAVSPEGRRIVSASWDFIIGSSVVRLWDLPTEQSRLLRGHTGAVNFVTFSPDGKMVASASSDGSVRLWKDDLPFEPAALHAWMDRVTDSTIVAR